ncbi:MAG: alpha/beta hydrolase [Clostridia bacterium]|nr:alpha/beta hydrolase [Clostridia bacterium]
MTLILIILALMLFVFFGLTVYFFFITFVKMRIPDLEDVYNKDNEVFKEYVETFKTGVDFINNSPYTWIYTLSFDGLKLAARYYDIKSDKTIILFHGYRSLPARDFSYAVKMYSELGYNVLLCEQRAHGRSEGKLISFGIRESRDVSSWVTYISEKYKCRKIALCGISMGATTVLLSLKNKMQNEVKCVIADCGFTSPEEIIRIVGKKAFNLNAKIFLPFLNFYCKILGKFSIKGVSTVDIIKKTKMPVLLIHGEADSFVPCDMSKEVYNAAKNGNVRLITVKNANHGMSGLVDRKNVYCGIKKFLRENVV